MTTCHLDWCDGDATSQDTFGLCWHHRRLELQAAGHDQRMFYRDLADYYRDEDHWVTALPSPPRPKVDMAPVHVPQDTDGSRYGLAALGGMVSDLTKTVQDGRSDALMRMAYRAARMVREGHLNEQVVRTTVNACLEALYPQGDRADKRARARKRAQEAIRDGLTA